MLTSFKLLVYKLYNCSQHTFSFTVTNNTWMKQNQNRYIISLYLSCRVNYDNCTSLLKQQQYLSRIFLSRMLPHVRPFRYHFLLYRAWCIHLAFEILCPHSWFFRTYSQEKKNKHHMHWNNIQARFCFLKTTFFLRWTKDDWWIHWCGIFLNILYLG